ncbi:MAG TPA: hypothetical protein DCQ31_16710 [Bacteroidales bacterium]|nr:hypothetical protein [Bacteroidales bacterium]
MLPILLIKITKKLIQMRLFSSKKSNIPAGDAEFLALCKTVSDNYSKSNFEIDSCSKQQLAAMVSEYKNLLTEMYEQRTDRNPAIKDIDAARKKHDNALSYVKAYITDKYGKQNAPSYFAEFGIERQNGAYKLPFAQDMRAVGLDKMVKALQKHGFTENTYGVNFWAPLAIEYKRLLELNLQATGNISSYGAQKNEIKDQLKQGLTNIRFFVRAKFPTTYNAEWRKLGFLKERF